MFDICKFPIGIRQLREDYHHFHHMGYDVRTTVTDITYGEITVEIWTEPNIFHGYVLLNLNDDSISGIIYNHKGVYYEALEFNHPDMYILANKIIKLYKELIKNCEYIL